MKKKQYRKPAIVHTEPLVAVAAVCPPPTGKGDFTECGQYGLVIAS